MSGGLGDIVRRTEGVQPWRRAFHAFWGVALVVWVEYGGLDVGGDLLVLGVGIVACLALDWVRLRRHDANVLFFRSFRALASPREARGIASSTWFLMGVFATLLVVPPHLFAPAVLVLAFADPAASVVGRLWGRRRLGKGSWEGTGAFFLVAFAVMAPFVGVTVALVAAAAVAAFEVLPTGIDDNLTLPVVAGLALWVVGG